MTEQLAFLLTIGIAAACGAATGRVFAEEGQTRRTSIFAAAYCGAGAGLIAAPLLAFLLVLTSELLDGQTAAVWALASAGEAVGPALLWGAVGGAGGGLLAGIAVALCKSYAPRSR